MCVCGSVLMTSSDVICCKKEGFYWWKEEGALLVERVWSLVVGVGYKKGCREYR